MRNASFSKKERGRKGKRKLFTRIATLDVQTQRFAMACRRCAVGTGRSGWWLKWCVHVEKYENDQYLLLTFYTTTFISSPLPNSIISPEIYFTTPLSSVLLRRPCAMQRLDKVASIMQKTEVAGPLIQAIATTTVMILRATAAPTTVICVGLIRLAALMVGFLLKKPELAFFLGLG